MFSIIKENFGEFITVTLHNRNTNSKLTIVPQLGCLINDWKLPILGKNYGVLDNYGTPEDLSKNHLISYKGARLLPFPNRIAGGSYEFDGKHYQLPINFNKEGHAAHGFISSIDFNLIGETKGNDFARTNFEGDYQGEIVGYPFPFKIVLTYELRKRNLLEIKVKVTNTGRSRMPFGDGWHPYFKTGSKVNSLKLRIIPEYAVDVDSRMIPTGAESKFDTFSESMEIKEQFFDSCFKNPAGRVSIIDEQKELEALFWQETGHNQYQFTQLYTPEGRDTISVEPVTSEPNAFNSGKGLIILEPNQSIHLAHGIEIHQ
jgi:aldose 1-epimerase